MADTKFLGAGVNKELFKEFEELCASRLQSPSMVIKYLMSKYVEENRHLIEEYDKTYGGENDGN